MTGKNATPLIGWHPPVALVARLKAAVKRRGGGRGVQSEILTEALEAHLDRTEIAAEHRTTRETPEPPGETK